jgi:hypothetical protein
MSHSSMSNESVYESKRMKMKCEEKEKEERSYFVKGKSKIGKISKKKAEEK